MAAAQQSRSCKEGPQAKERGRLQKLQEGGTILPAGGGRGRPRRGQLCPRLDSSPERTTLDV